MEEATYGDITETYIGTDRMDGKGREIGYIVGFRDNGEDFRAYVQNARRVNGEWKEFGVQQRSRSFPTPETSTAWAYATAQVRRHKVRQQNHRESTMPRTINPEKVSFMQLADTDILVEAANGVIDLNKLAREILANRGINQQTGRWIGFAVAREQLGAKNAN